MEKSVAQYFKSDEIIFLSEMPELSFEERKAKVPRVTKGWHELCQIPHNVRFELIRDYWFNSLPNVLTFRAFIDRFFSQVDHVGVIASTSGLFMTYTLKDKPECFFGCPPLVDDEIAALKKEIDFPLPEDYALFFRVHNGFFKGGDTGLHSADRLLKERERFKTLGKHLTLGKETASTELLLPFYRSFDLDVYQCFYKEWHPDQGMGNVLCNLKEGALSDPNTDPRAFPTFLEWLTFYMEKVL
ncbi:MAG: SMI1/KNR4 family protein [Chlamydiia bacterium]|nr:SMI1/KNR4 family protein [Chlamydiia bacterium]